MWSINWKEYPSYIEVSIFLRLYREWQTMFRWVCAGGSHRRPQCWSWGRIFGLFWFFKLMATKLESEDFVGLILADSGVTLSKWFWNISFLHALGIVEMWESGMNQGKAFDKYSQSLVGWNFVCNFWSLLGHGVVLSKCHSVGTLQPWCSGEASKSCELSHEQAVVLRYRVWGQSAGSFGELHRGGLDATEQRMRFSAWDLCWHYFVKLFWRSQESGGVFCKILVVSVFAFSGHLRLHQHQTWAYGNLGNENPYGWTSSRAWLSSGEYGLLWWGWDHWVAIWAL